ncbi:subtilisin-like protein [Acephala macrosclerotiorum]|nr:subtilisin-like protein [Acephala macrosclerotiorum]
MSPRFGVPGPEVIPGVNVTSTKVAAVDIITNSWFLVYKSGTISKPTFNLNGFKAIHVETDAIGLSQIGNASVVLPQRLSFHTVLCNFTNEDKIHYVERNVRISLDPMLDASEVITKSPAFKPRNQESKAPWELARISHKEPGFTNYIYDPSACDNTIVYVIDSGILALHKDFGGRASWGANFVPDEPNTDIYGHDTHCAGIIMGAESGVRKLGEAVVVKVIDKIGFADWNAVMQGMAWGTLPAALVVVSSGNIGSDASEYSPSSAPDAMATGAIDKNDIRPSWSNWGASVYVFAPGVDIVIAPHMAGLTLYYIAKENITTTLAVIERVIGAATVGLVANP